MADGRSGDGTPEVPDQLPEEYHKVSPKVTIPAAVNLGIVRHENADTPYCGIHCRSRLMPALINNVQASKGGP